MPKLVTILYLLCFGLLLMANVYHMSSGVKDEGVDMGSIVSFVDTEEIKNMADSQALIEEQALLTNTGSLPLPATLSFASVARFITPVKTLV